MKTSSKKWEHFSHGADIGIRGFGNSLEEAFAMAALALTAVTTKPESVHPIQSSEVHCQAPDSEILFCDWINALIYEMDTRHMVFSRFEVSITDNKLRAKIWGETADSNKHLFRVEPKGATMTELKVKRKDNTWLAQCVVDV